MVDAPSNRPGCSPRLIRSVRSSLLTTPDTFGAPVALDTDVYVPDRKPPPGGFPLVEIFHGGGSTKDNAYDSAHARAFKGSLTFG